MHPGTGRALIGAAARALLLALAAASACAPARAVPWHAELPICAHCGEVDAVVALGATATIRFGYREGSVTSSDDAVLEVVDAPTIALGPLGVVDEAFYDVIVRGVAEGHARLVLRAPGHEGSYLIAVAPASRATLVGDPEDAFDRADPEALTLQVGARATRRAMIWDAQDRVLLADDAAVLSAEGDAITIDPDGRPRAVAAGDAILRGAILGVHAELPIHVLTAEDFGASAACWPQTEVCNGLDGDCDGLVDEGGDEVCAIGTSSRCVEGVCRR